MVKPTPVLSAAGDYEEALERYAKHLGKDQIRRRVFNEIYGRTKRPRSKKEIMDAAGIENKGNKSQQVQNALECLSKHQLIERHDNDGNTNDGSHFVYGKAEFIRANKDKIIRYADNSKAAKGLQTKRRPGVQGAVSIRQVKKQALKKKKHLNVLYLTANPVPASHLRVDAEVRMVQEAIQSSKYRDNITLHFRPAADLDSLTKGLNDHRPQVVHFSGHGNEGEIAADTGKLGQSNVQTLPFGLLAKAIAATDNPPDVVVLNSCKSSAAKNTLLPTVKIIIAMRDSVSDIAAANFAQNFYAAIASGQSVKAGFDQGKVAVEVASISEADTPELHCASGVNPASIVLT